MGFKSLVYILIISTIFMSCSTVNYSTHSNEIGEEYGYFNLLGSRNSSKIYLLNGEKIESRFVHAANDSLYYEIDEVSFGIPIETIEKVEIKQIGGAIVFGIGLGTVTFLVTGVVSGIIAGNGLAGLVIGATAGTILGFSIIALGLLSGGISEYIFNDKANYEQTEYYKKYHERKAERDSTNL